MHHFRFRAQKKKKEPWSTHLLDHIEGELQALALKHGEQVSQEDREVLMAVPEGDEDSHLQEMAGKGAISWLLAPAYQQVLFIATKLCTPGCATLGER